ncbi:MAG: spondin domain-containing protein [Gammaproteobacteria bacterium]|nr:spondin domain-containing protein [Gammaproteobacteria bacterium]
MKRTTSISAACLLAATSLMATVSNADDDDMVMYKVTITNVMHANTLAPVLVATHESGMSFFKVGDAPDDELAWLSEAGNGNPMREKLLGNPMVNDAQLSDGGIPAGQSKSVIVKASKDERNVSVGSMIGKSNDAFAGLRDVRLPRGDKSVTYTADGYDAGAESNDETVETVPACGMGAAAAYSGTETGEGFIHIHNGIRGKGCLDADTQDWKNPVAYITIQRMKN